MQWPRPVTSDDCGLLQLAKRCNDPNTGHGREAAEKFWRRIRKWIMAKRTYRDDRNFVQRAEHRRLRQQHQIPTGKVNSFVPRLGPRHTFAGRAPMLPVKITGRKFENGQRLDTRQLRRSEKPPERMKFGSLPHKALPDEDRMNLPVTFRHFDQQRTTIHTAADQNADGTFYLAWRTLSFSSSSLPRSF